MIYTVIIILSIMLDGIMTNFLPYVTGNLSLFTPLLTVTSLVIIYPFFLKDKNKYYIISVVMGIIYDLFYTNLLFFDGISFLLLAFVITQLHKIIGNGYFRILLTIVIIIILYELLMVTGIILFNLVPITFDKVVYKISHSLILNLIYGEIIYLILTIIPRKYLNINLK